MNERNELSYKTFKCLKQAIQAVMLYLDTMDGKKGSCVGNCIF